MEQHLPGLLRSREHGERSRVNDDEKQEARSGEFDPFDRRINEQGEGDYRAGFEKPESCRVGFSELMGLFNCLVADCFELPVLDGFFGVDADEFEAA